MVEERRGEVSSENEAWRGLPYMEQHGSIGTRGTKAADRTLMQGLPRGGR